MRLLQGLLVHSEAFPFKTAGRLGCRQPVNQSTSAGQCQRCQTDQTYGDRLLQGLLLPSELFHSKSAGRLGCRQPVNQHIRHCWSSQKGHTDGENEVCLAEHAHARNCPLLHTMWAETPASACGSILADHGAACQEQSHQHEQLLHQLQNRSGIFVGAC